MAEETDNDNWQTADFDWGSRGVESVTKTHHSEPSAAIDPSKVQLQKPFVVCVVGASRAIGAGVATSYAKAGATGIVLASRRVSGLQETAEQCRKLNPEAQVEIVPCDITSAESVAALAEKVKGKFSRLDVVAVNSGYSGPTIPRVTETDPKTFSQAVQVNYVGTFHCAKYFIPLLLGTQDGPKAFVAVSTIALLLVRGPIANAQYTVSKAAQLRLMENIHEQYFHEGLSAYSVHPGTVPTEMAMESAPEEFKKYIIDSEELCGAWCVWLTRERERRRWLSGRVVSANWDAEELEGRKEEIERGDLLKWKVTLPPLAVS